MDRDDQVLGLISDMKAVCNPAIRPSLQKIEDGVERMTTELAVLRLAESQPPNIDLRRNLKISPKAALLLDMLQRAGSAGLSTDRILASIYSGTGKEWPQRNIIKVWLTHIRAALKRTNAQFHIETIWGWGYRVVEGPAP